MNKETDKLGYSYELSQSTKNEVNGLKAGKCKAIYMNNIMSLRRLGVGAVQGETVAGQGH